MSVVKEYFYNFKCDVCGALCDEEMWQVDEDTVIDVEQEQGWWIEEGKHYCPDCHEFDDEDNLIVKGGSQ